VAGDGGGAYALGEEDSHPGHRLKIFFAYGSIPSMQWKVIAILVGLLVIAVLAYAFLSSIAPEGTELPRGPVGAPYVEGPSGPPPGNN